MVLRPCPGLQSLRERDFEVSASFPLVGLWTDQIKEINLRIKYIYICDPGQLLSFLQTLVIYKIEVT